MAADAVSIVEAGYDAGASDDEWVAQICKTSWAAYGLGKGCFAYRYDASTPGLQILSPKSSNPDFEILAGMAGQRVPLPEPVLAAIYETSAPVSLGSEIARLGGIDYAMVWTTLQQWVGSDVTDVIGVRAGGSDRQGLVVAFVLTGAAPHVAPRTREALGRVGAHLASAYRLRRFARETASVDGASAVLTPAGRVEHLGADPDAEDHRGALVDAVRRMERARGRASRGAPEESLALWRALVAGRWSVVDFVDRDGKRFIVARRNELRGRDLLAISGAERQVLQLASLGRTNKLIAYELGLAPSTVSAQLKRGLQKLGLASRAELVAHRRREVSSKC